MNDIIVSCVLHDPLMNIFSPLQPGVEPGDVILVLQQKDHELFTRQGDDLFMTKKLHLAEALCGFHMVIKHLDKRNLIVKYPAGQVIEPGWCCFFCVSSCA